MLFRETAYGPQSPVPFSTASPRLAPTGSLSGCPAHLLSPYLPAPDPQLFGFPTFDRSLSILHDRRDSYPAVTILAGTGLSPAGKTSLLTAHLAYFTALNPFGNAHKISLVQ